MSPTTIAENAGRRAFLKGAGLAGGGLLLGCCWNGATLAVESLVKPSATPRAGGFELNAFICISPEGVVTLVSKQPEIGQGIKTSLPMVIAEQLEVDWQDVVVVQGDLDPVYGSQSAGGSRSTPTNYEAFHLLGATARTLLVAAAAQTWGVAPGECYAQDGAVHHRDGKRQLAYGQLAATAASLPVPDSKTVVLKNSKNYRLLGRRIGGVDNAAIVAGRPLFGIDVKLPGMLYAVYEKCPVFAGRVVKANIDLVKSLPGVRDVFVIDGTTKLNELMPGVAIVAESTWAALSARRQLEVVWDEGKAAADTWEGFVAQAAALQGKAGATALRNDGDVDAALAGARATVEAAYSYPFIAHASFEPQNCTAWFKDGVMELWAPSQTPATGQALVAATLGIAKDKVAVHLMRSGGGFGRRLSADYMLEAAAIAHRVAAPVKLTWSREDDLRHDHYRAGGFHFLRGGIDAKGRVVAWHNHHVTFANSVARDGTKSLQVGIGAGLSGDEFPGRWLKNCRLEQTPLQCGVPMGAWRAPGSNVLAWVFHSFIDELAHAARRDPLEFSLELLGDRDIVPAADPRGMPYDVGRMRRVVAHAAEKAAWGKRTYPRGKGAGLAFHFSHRGYVAQVAEVSVSREGRLSVDRVVVAVDVGAQIVNLSGAENQVQGSVIDALGTLLYQELDIRRGRIVQSNFHDYPMIGIADIPAKIDIHFVNTDHPVTGLGEPAFPPLAPAVCNAIFAATGKRVRQLPLSRTDLRWS